MSSKLDNPRPLSVPSARDIDDPSGYDPRKKLCPQLSNEWPARDTLATTDPEAAE